MRIDAINKVSQLYKANGVKKYNSINKANASDRLEISQIGKDYQIAKQAVASASEVREDKVNAIKQAIADGTYRVSDSNLADKLLESFDI